MTSNELRESTHNVLKSTKNLIISLYNLAPVAALVTLIFLINLIWVIRTYPSCNLAIVLIVLIIVSIFIYMKTNDYGQAALGLVAGLLAAFTVKWNTKLTIIFVAIWITFAGFTMLYQSIKIAAKYEDIFRQASIWIDFSNLSDVEKKLKTIPKTSLKGMIGPLEAAEAIRLLAFYRHPIEFMGGTLTSIEMIATLTELDYKRITMFHAELYKMMKSPNELIYHKQIECVYDIVRNTSVPPNEFFEAFEITRKRVLSGEVELNFYFELIQSGLENGYNPNEISGYITQCLNDDGDMKIH